MWRKLSVTDYRIHSSWRQTMQTLKFHDTTFEDIIHGAMWRLVRSIGEPWMRQVQMLHDANPPDPQWGYTQQNIERYFRDGFYKFNQEYDIGWDDGSPNLIRNPKLLIRGPSQRMKEVGAWGAASHGGYNVKINVTLFRSVYHEQHSTLEEMEIDIATTLIHEIMHTHGFRHPSMVNQGLPSDPAHPYMRSMPVVASNALWNLYRDSIGGDGALLTRFPHIMCLNE